MPLVSGKDDPSVPDEGGPRQDAGGETVRGKIRATRKLLLTAALIMSVMLILSSVVANLLIPESAYRAGGPADGRAIAYLAHKLLGDMFGSVYDFSTILVLWFAGASAMTGLLSHPALSSALWNGSALGSIPPSVGSVVTGARHCNHLDISSQCGGARKRLRHGRARPLCSPQRWQLRWR